MAEEVECRAIQLRVMTTSPLVETKHAKEICKRFFISVLLTTGKLMRKPLLTDRNLSVNRKPGGWGLVRHFVVFVLLSLILIGVMTPPESIASVESDSCAISKVHSETTNSPESNPADCDHEGMPCHSCHLGHCLFDVAHSISFSLLDNLKHHLATHISIEASDFRSNLFRPPIS